MLSSTCSRVKVLLGRGGKLDHFSYNVTKMHFFSLIHTPGTGTPNFCHRVSNMGPIFFPVYGQTLRRTVSRDMPFFSVIGHTHARKQTHV